MSETDTTIPQLDQLPKMGESPIRQLRRDRGKHVRAENRTRLAAQHNYLTLEEAIAVLDVSPSQLRRLATKHGIRRDRDRGFYDLEQICALADKRKRRKEPP